MRQKLFNLFLILVLIYVVLALCIQVYMVTISLTNPDLATEIYNDINSKLDNIFGN